MRHEVALFLFLVYIYFFFHEGKPSPSVLRKKKKSRIGKVTQEGEEKELLRDDCSTQGIGDEFIFAGSHCLKDSKEFFLSQLS